MAFELKHPDFEWVGELINSLLADIKTEGWHLGKLTYDFYSSSYNVVFSKDASSAQAKIPREMMDDVYSSDDHFKRRKVKKMIKEAIGINTPD